MACHWGDELGMKRVTCEDAGRSSCFRRFWVVLVAAGRAGLTFGSDGSWRAVEGHGRLAPRCRLPPDQRSAGLTGKGNSGVSGNQWAGCAWAAGPVALGFPTPHFPMCTRTSVVMQPWRVVLLVPNTTVRQRLQMCTFRLHSPGPTGRMPCSSSAAKPAPPCHLSQVDTRRSVKAFFSISSKLCPPPVLSRHNPGQSTFAPALSPQRVCGRRCNNPPRCPAEITRQKGLAVGAS